MSSRRPTGSSISARRAAKAAGEIVACGTPEEVLRNRRSHTAAGAEESHAQRKGRMSKYRMQPLDFGGLKTVPIHERGGKVRLEHFARPYQKGEGVARLLDSLPRLWPRIRCAAWSKRCCGAMQQEADHLGHGRPRDEVRPAPVLLDLMRRGGRRLS